MPLWKRFWLLLSLMWVVVSLLHVATLFAFEDSVTKDKLATLLLATVLVPAVLYGIGCLWETLRRDRP
jgi:hypothetical protein